jgi:molybdopterin-binding protein
MKLSARNQIPGTVVSVAHGAVNGTIKVDIGGGTVVTSSITEEAIAELALAAGDQVVVVIKSSDVLIGKD